MRETALRMLTGTCLMVLAGCTLVQLFDLQNDPDEVHNLAIDPEKNRATLLRMNALLNDLIVKEVGVNDGRFLTPYIPAK